MRNALILLAAVALLILVGGALNNGVVFDVDYAVGSVRAVSLLWVSAVIAALVFVVGLIAAYLAQMAVFASRRKLEAELQTTYERLREAETLAARPAPAVAATVVAAEAEIVEDATMVVDDATTVVDAGEAATMVGTGEEATAPAGVDAGHVEADDADAGTDAGTDAGEAGEATAVTMAAGAEDAAVGTEPASEAGDDSPATTG